MVDEASDWDNPRPMMLSFLYVVLQRLLELLVLRRKDEAHKDLEIVVLRHQLVVLQRQVGCGLLVLPRLEPSNEVNEADPQGSAQPLHL